MHYASLLLCAASAASASVLPREANVFHITDFEISGSPGSVYTKFYSELVLAQGSDTLLCQESSSTIPVSPYAPNTTCSTPEWSFSFESTENNDGYTLVVDYDGATGLNFRGCRFYPNSDIEYVDDSSRGPGAQYVRVKSEQNFTLPYNTNGQC